MKYLKPLVSTIFCLLAVVRGSVVFGTEPPAHTEGTYVDEFPSLPLSADSSVNAVKDWATKRSDQLDTAFNTSTAHFQWSSALREAFFFTGSMHVYRLASESATRDALHGHWWRNYKHSIGELRGWDDGDAFLTSYIAHPMEGAVFGYIAQQNDPRYSQVMWGDGRTYWIGRLRTLAFSAALSTQWTLGPLSEASIGNVQLRDSPGFVDLVGTPVFGTLVMMAEDAADRYLVIGLENRTANKTVLLLARCFLTPTRAFANTLALKHPWHRDGRIGIFGANNELRQELLRAYNEGTGSKIYEYTAPRKSTELKSFPRIAPIELESSAHYETFLGGGSCVGGGGSGALRIHPRWQIVSEVNGRLVVNMPSSESGDSMRYLAGTRWTPRAAGRMSPYLQVMVGGRRITHEIDDPIKRDKLMGEWADGQGPIHYPKRSDWSRERQENGLAVSAGGGLDIAFGRAFAWRLGNLEYTHSWLGDADQIHAANSLLISSSLILRIGTW